MAGTNQFYPMAIGAGSNVMANAAYAASSPLNIGQQPGIASSAFNNTALRQATYIISQLAQVMVNYTGLNALDDATPANMLALMNAFFKTPPQDLVFTANGTLTVPVGAVSIEIEAVGGGGGGQGGGPSGGGGAGGNGTATTFGTGASQISAGGGAGGSSGAIAAGGTGSLGSLATGDILPGADGDDAATAAGSVNVTLLGGRGASSTLGGSGPGGGNSSAGGKAAKANSGSGGGGAASDSGGTVTETGAPGAAGCTVRALLVGPFSPTYAVVVGAGGAAGAAASGPYVGGAGGSGRLKARVRFQ